MRARILLRFTFVVFATVGLMLFWLASLPHSGQAASLVSAAPPASATLPAAQEALAQAPAPAATPDPRWVEIVRTQEPRAEPRQRPPR